MKTTWAQLHVYTKTYMSLYLGSPLNDAWDPLVSIIIFFLSSLVSITQPSMFPSLPSLAGHPLTCGRGPPRAARRPLPFSALRAAAPAFALPLRPSLSARTGSLPLPLLSPPNGLPAPATVEPRGRPAPPLFPPSGRCEARGRSGLSIWAEEQGPLRREEDQGGCGVPEHGCGD
jgi:hypothetical protein